MARAGELLTHEEARRIAANIAKLPGDCSRFAAVSLRPPARRRLDLQLTPAQARSTLAVRSFDTDEDPLAISGHR